jgi:hypothetical protein
MASRIGISHRELGQDQANFGPGKHDGKAPGTAGADDALEAAGVSFQHLLVNGKESRALKAWFWVEALTWPSTARCVRNWLISAAPISREWRLP